MSWKPHRPPTVIGDASIQYLRGDQTHRHDGAHDVAVDGHTLRVLPQPHTTARRRYDSILRATTTCEEVAAALAFGYADFGFRPHAYLIGYLLTAGIRHLELDGRPLFDRPEATGQWSVVLTDRGGLEATWLGPGDREPT